MVRERSIVSISSVRVRRSIKPIACSPYRSACLTHSPSMPSVLPPPRAPPKNKAGPGIRFNEHMEGDGETVFRHTCKLGLEGVVSKRKDSAYRSGRSPDWLKMKNPAAAAVKREAEEDWGYREQGTRAAMEAP